MKIILTQNVTNLGKAGEIKEVKEGYGRNFLLAKSLAVLPGDPKAKDILLSKAESSKEKKEKAANLAEQASALNGKEFKFKVKTDDKGNLYGSLGPKEIAGELGVSTNLIKDHYKKIGTYDLEVKFDAQNVSKVKIVIEKEK